MLFKENVVFLQPAMKTIFDYIKFWWYVLKEKYYLWRK